MILTDIIELDGKQFVPAEQSPLPVWPSVLGDLHQPTLTLKDDDLFLITDTVGNIAGYCRDDRRASMGLFCKDTRFLSRLELQIENRTPVLLSSTAQKGFILSVLCTNPLINNNIKAETIAIKREIVLNGGLFEEIEICNYSTNPVTFELSLSFEADFMDLFEIRGFKREKRGRILRATSGKSSEIISPETFSEHQLRPEKQGFTMAYQGLDNSIMESRIQFAHHLPDTIKGYTAVWQIKLECHETKKLGYRLEMFTNNKPTSNVSTPANLLQAKAAELSEEENWRQKVTLIRSDRNLFNQIIERSEQDIYLLRQSFGDRKVLAAGVPWFSTLFGRDSIIAAYQTLMLDPAIAQETLSILAQYQGKKEDQWRDEQPGKILHEIRLGEMARCQEVPHTPYYGTVDATPLWLMLYAEYFAWTADSETIERLWPNALAAMDWIDNNINRTGYLTYNCQSKRGLNNQGWKDSSDCIVNRKGQMAQGPIALSEVQAYVYNAKIRMSEIARMKGSTDLAERWNTEAKELKIRFNRDFWMPDQDFCALALDGNGNQVDSITSNPGHCLYFGILELDKALNVAQRMLAPDMFNGWGIRTLSSMSPAYNPMGYHVGSVWPHDNALIMMGMRSLGLIEPALEVFRGIMDMTKCQPYQRPPELFCGYDRHGDTDPVQYPVACSPQAWATGSIFQMLQMIVNLVPDAPSNCLRIIEPRLPESINHLSVHNLRVGATVLDLEFGRSGDTTSCRVAKKQGNLRVVIEA